MVGDFVLGCELTFVGREKVEIVTRFGRERLRTHRKRISTVPVSMPSVEMRRSTRVFGARVLRSGRRLLTGEDGVKHMRRPVLAPADGDEDWIELLDRDGDDDVKDVKGFESIDDTVIVDEQHKEIQLGQSEEVDSVNVDDNVDDCDGDFGTENRRWGVVYSRKRRRNESTDCSDVDKRFGMKFFRNQSRKKIVTEMSSSSGSPPNTTAAAEPCFVRKSKSRKKVTRVSVSKPMRLNLPTLPPRNRVSINRGFQKRRSSLRLRKRRNPSSVVQDGVPFYPMKSNLEISKAIRRASFREVKEITHDIDSASCNASILVIESDRGHREKGAVITMETSGPNRWFLVVKRNGVERFRFEAQTIMRPCCCNRVTNAIIWAGGDERWKLEFPNRQDWFVFKQLYRECSGRTVRVLDSLSSIIPVPRVTEVSGYMDEKYVPFKMPDSYISSRGDEISRILEKSGPVYEMDSDDDEWLNRFNDGRDSNVDDDTFEKIVDAFERGMYCSPDDYSDVKMAVDRCSMLASEDVLEAVYGYWMARRKNKHSALVQVFQLYKPKKPDQLNLRAVLRKKRSLRQRGTQAGRGKQLTFLKAALFENTKTEPAHAENTAKVEEAAEAAKRAEEAAVICRQRAQVLMEVADLLTYKAAIAVKIAEARATVGSVDDSTFDELFLPANRSGLT